LHEVVAQQGPLDVPTVARIGLGVLAALRAAHANGVLHRDVKPGNVLITLDGRVVLSDFGLATIIGDPAVTRSGMLIGSPSYMAPERAADADAGPAADLWSLGATLYFALEGRPPYERSSPLATITALATEEPPPAPRAGALAAVVEGLLQRSPEARLSPADADRLLRDALIPHAHRRASAVPMATRPVGTRPGDERDSATTVRRPPGRRPAAPLMLVVGCVAVILTAWAIGLGSTPDPGTTAPNVERPTSAATAPSPAAAPTTAAEPTSALDEGTAPLTLPAGWHRYTDETGFSVAVPESWAVSRTGSIVYFREPNGSRYLGIDQTDQPQPDPVADWTGKEAFRVARGDFPGYERIRIEEVPYFLKAADWEFTYLVAGGRAHVLNCGFITSPNQAYGIWWSTPDSQWDASLVDLALIRRSFTPAG
jgi:hypothetical protein